jgi:anti-sigma regulatory factor (Ser/Thr protein kinase)
VKSRVRVTSESELSRAIVEAGRVATAAGLSKHEVNKFATAVSELGRNILKYAGTGEIALAEVLAGNRPGSEAIVTDRGPGIADVEEALRDHYSSSGTLGLGLPGVKRMMDEFEIDSSPGQGTKVIVRIFGKVQPTHVTRALRDGAGQRADSSTRGRGWGGVLPGDRASGQRDVECAYFIRPCLGERVSGDGVLLDRRGDLVFIALLDALGHGQGAHEIAATARRHLRDSWSEDLVTTMAGLDQHLSGTEGAAAGFATFDTRTRELRYVGVGNVTLRPMGARDVRFQYVEGTLGARMRKPREQAIRMEMGEVALMFSDGVTERLRVDDYPQLRYEQVQTVARTIVERFGKTHDDASCIALRCVR